MLSDKITAGLKNVTPNENAPPPSKYVEEEVQEEVEGEESHEQEE